MKIFARKCLLRLTVACLALGTLAVSSGCLVTESSEEEPVDVELRELGISMSDDFANDGLLEISVLPQHLDGDGVAAIGLEYDVSITNPNDTTASPHTVKTIDGARTGEYAILIDSSGSMGDYDPNNQRHDVTKIMINEIFNQSPDSLIGLYDWGSNPDAPADWDLTYTNPVQDLTDSSQKDALLEGAEQIGSSGGTPLYSSMLELVEYLDERTQNSGVRPALIALTDGADTRSADSIEDVIERAKEANIPLLMIGIGPASREHPDTDTDAVRDAERMARETDGFYVSIENLDVQGGDEMFRDVAQSATSGFDTAVVKLDPIPASGTNLTGSITATGPKVKDSNTLPFEFLLDY
jgi:hypothetical protein